MKNLLIITLLTIAINSINAQPPQRGGGGGGRGGRPGNPPSEGMRQPSSAGEGQLMLEVFPQLPDLTLEQRAEVGSILAKEYNDLAKQQKKKREVERKRKEHPTDKDLEKERKKREKIDKKMLGIREKTNKKVKKQLSDEQYAAFLEKREEFKFKRQPEGRPEDRENGKQNGREERRPGNRGGRPGM